MNAPPRGPVAFAATGQSLPKKKKKKKKKNKKGWGNGSPAGGPPDDAALALVERALSRR